MKNKKFGLVNLFSFFILFSFIFCFSAFAQTAQLSVPQNLKDLYSRQISGSQGTNNAGAYADKIQTQNSVVDTIVYILIAYFLLLLLVKIINKRVRDVKARHALRKNTIYFINLLLLLAIFLTWIQKINSFTILLGFVSAGLALALQEVVLSIAGWFLILARRPFEAGDRIEINGVKGDVIDIRLLQTSLLEIGNWVDADQSTGRIVNVPNSYVFKHAHFNYSRGFEFIWNVGSC